MFKNTLDMAMNVDENGSYRYTTVDECKDSAKRRFPRGTPTAL